MEVAPWCYKLDWIGPNSYLLMELFRIGKAPGNEGVRRVPACPSCHLRFSTLPAKKINSQSLEDMQVGYFSQKYTLDNYTLEKYTLAQKSLMWWRRTDGRTA